MSIFYNRKNDEYKFGIIGITIFLAVVVIVAIGMAIFPMYSVWSSKKAGEAKLAKAKYAEYTAKIKAKAKMEAADYLAQAEVARAKGVAKSVRIVGQALNENPGYLDYRYIQNLKNNKNNQVIYLPSKNGIPIFRMDEAGRGVKK
jgi:regulator of protease activity HflC (stomatin/prohibitin superfamily)